MTAALPELVGADEEFFDALARADERDAVELARRLLDAGAPAEDVLLGLVAPAQERAGRLWQAGVWSVAQEHAATCINERVVAAVGALTRESGERGHVVVACLDGEWHALAARIVAEVLRVHGWRVTFLGASVPAGHLVSFLHQHGPDVVAVSCALPIHLPAAHQTVVAAQRTGTPVLAGGPGFGPGGRWARTLGVDAWAPTARDAVDLLGRLPWPAPVPDGRTGPGAEYAGLRARRARLVTAGVDRLRAAGTGPFSDSDLEDDVGQVVDFLAAAVYLGDSELFTDYLAWLAAVATARSTSTAALPEVLEELRTALHDFDLAQHCLAAGRDELIGSPTTVPGGSAP